MAIRLTKAQINGLGNQVQPQQGGWSSSSIKYQFNGSEGKRIRSRTLSQADLQYYVFPLRHFQLIYHGQINAVSPIALIHMAIYLNITPKIVNNFDTLTWFWFAVDHCVANIDFTWALLTLGWTFLINRSNSVDLGDSVMSFLSVASASWDVMLPSESKLIAAEEGRTFHVGNSTDLGKIARGNRTMKMNGELDSSPFHEVAVDLWSNIIATAFSHPHIQPFAVQRWYIHSISVGSWVHRLLYGGPFFGFWLTYSWRNFFFMTVLLFVEYFTLLVWLNIVYKEKHCYRKNYFKGGLT